MSAADSFAGALSQLSIVDKRFQYHLLPTEIRVMVCKAYFRKYIEEWRTSFEYFIHGGAFKCNQFKWPALIRVVRDDPIKYAETLEAWQQVWVDDEVEKITQSFDSREMKIVSLTGFHSLDLSHLRHMTLFISSLQTVPNFTNMSAFLRVVKRNATLEHLDTLVISLEIPSQLSFFADFAIDYFKHREAGKPRIKTLVLRALWSGLVVDHFEREGAFRDLSRVMPIGDKGNEASWDEMWEEFIWINCVWRKETTFRAVE